MRNTLSWLSATFCHDVMDLNCTYFELVKNMNELFNSCNGLMMEAFNNYPPPKKKREYWVVVDVMTISES